MKTIAKSFALALLMGAGNVAADGTQLFKDLNCAICHNPTQDWREQGLGPSLTIIAEAYAGRQDVLVNFLAGEGKPKISPDLYPVMELQLATILYEKPRGQLQQLAGFLMSHLPEESPAGD